MTEPGHASPDPVSEGPPGRRPTEAETLLAVSQPVASTLELTEVVRRMTRALVRALGADVGGAWGGPDLARRLGARRPELKVPFVSGYPERGAGGPGPAVSSFLQKPFTPDVLAGKVREVLDRTS